MRRSAIVINLSAVIFAAVGMWLFSNIVNMNIPLMILMSILAMGLFTMLFINIREIVSKRNLKFNIISAITVLVAMVMLISIIMLSDKTLQLTESQNDILLLVTSLSAISFFIIAPICSRLEIDLKNQQNKSENEEKESEEMKNV